MPETNGETKATKGFLYQVERIGNKLPNPFFIFLLLTVVVVLVSALMQGQTVMHPGTGKAVAVKSLATADGFRWFLSSMITNFTGFAPLGMVLVLMLGLGLAEEVGLLGAALRRVVIGAPSYLVTVAVVFAGVNGSIGGSAIFAIIPPLGGLIFLASGKHPLAGIAAGFFGVGGGLAANLLLTGGDVTLAGLTTTAARIMDPKASVNPAMNWYFMIASTFVLTAVGAYITEKMLLPRLGKYNPADADEEVQKELESLKIGEVERRGLRNSGIAALVFVAVVALLVVPTNGVLRDPKTHTVVPSPFLNSLIPLLLALFVTVAVPYGLTTGSIKKLDDIYKHMSKAMTEFSGFIVLCFAAAQFVECFNWTNLSLLVSVNGAQALKAANIGGIPLLVGLVLLAFFADFFIGSASAKWALLAPILVPMFMQLKFSPELVQVAYRIGDSVTNQISPLEPFMPFIIACCQRYSKKSGFGTVLSMMLPYAGISLLVWILLLVVWVLLGLPLGPGARLFLS